MASGRRGRGRGRGGPTSFFDFAREPAPVNSPYSLKERVTHGVWSDGEEEKLAEIAVKFADLECEDGFDYVQKYKDEENEKFQKVRSTGVERSGRDHADTVEVGGASSGGGRGRGSGRAPSTLSNGRNKEAVYGEFPDVQEGDIEVYSKYNFKEKVGVPADLAIFKVKNKVLDVLKYHQVVIIEGFTGCGKTTQVPQFILDEAAENKVPCKIVVTQPRRIAAISVANRVANERNWITGSVVGYQVGLEKKRSEDTRLFYMTTGVLLQLLIGRKSLGEWSHIIIDEIHERDLDTDLLLLVIRKLMVDTRNHHVRIILMSATFNSEKFESYFPSWDSNGGAVKIKLNAEKVYPVEVVYLDEAIRETRSDPMVSFQERRLSPECAHLAIKIIESFDQSEQKESKAGNVERGAVLVFLPGLLEIETVGKMLVEASKAGTAHDKKWTLILLHSTITSEEQQRAFLPAPSGTRKVILATNIAESSITVPDIRYVIDFCLTKYLFCDNSTNYASLRLHWASKNECIQRKGRCGRVAPGKVYRLVPREFYEDVFVQEATPEMLRGSLESVMLQVKQLDMGSPKSIFALAVDPPELCKIRKAVCNLKEAGAMTMLANGEFDVYDGDMTFLGRVISRLPIDTRLGRLILLGYVYDCLYETVVIAAGLSVKTPFLAPLSHRLDGYSAKLKWSESSFSDCISLFNVYRAWVDHHNKREFANQNKERAWARSNFVQISSLREMTHIAEEIQKRLKVVGITFEGPAPEPLSTQQTLILKAVIAGAFYPNYFVRQPPDPEGYRKNIARDLLAKDPFNAVALHSFPHDQPFSFYEKQLSDYLQYETCVPIFTVEPPKVVAHFDSHGSYTGRISNAVYRAVRRRQIHDEIIIPIVRPNEYIGFSKMGQFSTRLTAHKQVGPCPLPSLETPSVQIIMTYVKAPDDFYVALSTDEENLKLVTEGLPECQEKLVVLQENQCKVSRVCIAYNTEKGTYYRGRIDAVKKDGIYLVTLIDHGSSVLISRSNMYTVHENSQEAYEYLFRIPALAIKCKLKGLQPPARNNYVWSTECIKTFTDFLTERQGVSFTLEIYGIWNGVICGTIVRSIYGIPDPKSINEDLLSSKFADSLERESDFIEDNSRVRQTAQADEERRPTWARAYATDLDDQRNRLIPEELMDPIKIPSNAFVRKLKIGGPSSPLEMEYYGLSRASYMKVAHPDGQSVNSVVLDQSPYAPCYQLMVAASVGIAERSGRHLAQNTTLMPPVPGITGILTMLFCPTLELRTDRHLSKYTGCLAGLGTDPRTGEGVYADHDMEIVFETEFSTEDLNDINYIRSLMSEALTDEVSRERLNCIRATVRARLVKLMECKRANVKENWPCEDHKWSPRNDVVRTGSGCVFPPLEKVKLECRTSGAGSGSEILA